MKVFTRDLGFVNFNEENMPWVKFNGVTIYEAWKNLTANGIPPLTLLKSGGKDLVDYKLYGNSVQKVDTSNIWDGTYTTGSYYDDTGNIVNNNSISMTDLMKLKYNKYDITSVITYDTYNFRYNFFDENKNWLSQILVRVTTTTPVITTIDVPEGAKYINFSVFTTQMTSGQKICANEQAIPTIESVGEYDKITEKYKIPVIARGKNIFNKNATPIKGGGYDAHYDIIPTDTGVRYELKGTNANTGVYLNNKYIIGKVSDFVGRVIRIKFDYHSSGSSGRFLLYTGNEKGTTKTYLSGLSTIENGTNISRNSSTITQAMVDDTDNPYIIAVFYVTSGTGYEEGEYKEYSNVCFCSSKYTSGYEPYVEPITTNIYLDEPLTINDYIHYKKQVISKNGLEETIELPSIPTVKGTCILEVDTGVQPSNMEVEYKGK
jgi:hypothetical protein